MTSNMTCFILLSAMLMCGLSFSQNIVPYSKAELVYDFPVNHERSCREVVMPEGGPFYEYSYMAVEREDSKDICSELIESEIDALGQLDKQFRVCPECQLPLMIQYSKLDRGQKKKRHIEGLCIMAQDGPEELFLGHDDYCVPSRPIEFSVLTNFKKLRHLEIFGVPLKIFSADILAQLNSLEYIGIPFDSSDSVINSLSHLKELEFLNASFTKVTGSNFEELANLPNLKILDLRYTDLSKDAISKLKHCKNLKTLLLTGSNVTDNHLQGLEDLVSLENLALSGTQITSLSLKRIEKLPNLRFLTIGGITATAQEIQQLQEKNPDLEIITKPVVSFYEYIIEHLYQKATMGDIDSQFDIYGRYYLTYRRISIYNREEDAEVKAKLISKHFNTHNYYPFDKTEFLKWAYVLLSPRKSLTSTESLRNQKRLEKYGVEKIKNELEKNMLPIEIAEARRRANTVLSLDRKYKIEPRTENYPCLPVYQWDFEFITDN